MIIARAPAATTAAASEAASRAGATAVVMVARRAGSSSPRGRRDCVAAAAGCGASATRGPAAATAATGSRRTLGSARRRARRVPGAASRDRPTGTTSGACGPPGWWSARRAGGRRYRTFLESAQEAASRVQQFPRRPWAAASASSCAGRPCLVVKQGGSNDGPQARAPALEATTGLPGTEAELPEELLPSLGAGLPVSRTKQRGLDRLSQRSELRRGFVTGGRPGS